MKKTSAYKTALVIAILFLLTALGLGISGHLAQAGPFFIAFFITLAIGFLGYPTLKGYAYTLVILAAVTTALYYPTYFKELNGFKFSTLITPLI